MSPQALVYILCLITSIGCAGLLVRAYLRTRTRLLLWSALCFVFLAINNCFVVADILIFPDLPLYPFRLLTSLLAVGVLLYGFIWETE